MHVAARIVAIVVVGALGLSPLQLCLSRPGMSAESQMACCKGGQENCQHRSSARECCDGDDRPYEQSALAKVKDELVGLRVLSDTYAPAMIGMFHSAATSGSSLLAYRHHIPRASAEPLFLFDSVLRI